MQLTLGDLDKFKFQSPAVVPFVAEKVMADASTPSEDPPPISVSTPSADPNSITLSDEQAAIVRDILDDAFWTKNKAVIISGGGGTGKSALLYFLQQKVRKSVVLAPTNMAANVVRARNVQNVHTFHSLLKCAPSYTERGPVFDVRIKDSFLKSTFQNTDYVFVDEISMVSEEFLLVLNRIYRLFPNIRRVYLGDRAQLPPVEKSDNGEHPSIETDVFEQHKVFELQHVFRQTSVQIPRIRQDILKSIYAYNARRLGTCATIFTDARFLSALAQEPIVTCIRGQRAFVESFVGHPSSKKIMLAFRNNTCATLNQQARTILFGAEDARATRFFDGEPLLWNHGSSVECAHCGENNVFTSGHRVFIARVDPAKEAVCDYTDARYMVERVHLADTCSACRMPVSITHVATQCTARARMDFEALRAALSLKARKCTRAAAEQLWRDYYEAYAQLFPAVGYGYACTIHKSQGSTFGAVYVHGTDAQFLTREELDGKFACFCYRRLFHARMYYVAVSRAPKVFLLI